MPYYLSQFLDGGVILSARVCRAIGQEEPGSAIINLRPDSSRVDGGGLNACLLYRPTDFIDPRVTKIADLPDEVIPTPRRNALATKLGATITETRWKNIVGQLLMTPPSGTWKPLQPEALGTRYAAYLGPLAWFQNVIAGGSGGRRVDLYERLQEAGGVTPRRLARDSFRRGYRHRLRRSLLSERGAVLATDAFTRADAATLGANWELLGSDTFLDLGIFSNQVDVTSVVDTNADRYIGVTWPNDHYSQVDTTANFGGGVGFAAVRGAASGTVRDVYIGGYANVFEANDNSRIFEYVGGTYTSIASVATDLLAGDLCYLEIQGSSLLLKVNGANRVGPSTDLSLTSGRASIACYFATVNQGVMDDWEGGDFVAGDTLFAQAVY